MEDRQRTTKSILDNYSGDVLDIPNADKTVVITREDLRIIVAVYPMSQVVDKPIKSILCLDIE